uniref:Uncharacterized protein n=1 Tax=Rhizophora mucronata TaxID=61149 RepID=A0A2P2QZL5_RHIMU
MSISSNLYFTPYILKITKSYNRHQKFPKHFHQTQLKLHFIFSQLSLPCNSLES